MSGFGGSLSGILLSAALGAGVSIHIVERGLPTPSVQVHRRRTKAVTSGGYNFTIGKFNYPDGPGWSNRQVKRMATKRRNQARNKKSHRG